MYPSDFDYHRASSVEDALDLLSRHDGAKLLAGGHSLLPMMKLRLAQPPTLIDIGRIDALRGISKVDGSVRIGALTTHAEVHASDAVRSVCPLLADAAGEIGDPQVRNLGTIGGNIVHADPASDPPAVLLAAGATVHLRGPSHSRAVPVESFFQGLLTADVAGDEILTAIEVSAVPPGSGSSYLKVEHPASGYAVCGAAAIVTMSGGSCAAARLCFNGVAETPHDALNVASALAGTSADARAIDAAMQHLAVADPLGDIYASGEYRLVLARAYGARALAAARDGAAAGT